MERKNNKPLVSVIIPAYNVEAYIEDAINSVLAQTYPNIEIIVVNDGSTDSTPNALDRFLEKKQITYVEQTNKGLAAARNKGVAEARGEYIALLDADDLFLPTKIEKQMKFMEENSDCDFCYCDLNFFVDGQPEKLLQSRYACYSGNVLLQLLKSNFINPSTLFFRKETFDKFGSFNEQFTRAEDLEYYLNVSLKGARFCFLNEPLFLSRIRKSGNLQANQVLMQTALLKIFENLKNKLSREMIAEYNINSIINKKKSKLALAYLMNGDKALARQILKELPTLGSKLLIYGLAILPRAILKTLLSQLIKTKRKLLYR